MPHHLAQPPTLPLQAYLQPTHLQEEYILNIQALLYLLPLPFHRPQRQLLLRAVIEIGPTRVGAQIVLEAVKLISKIKIEERYPAEAR